MGSRKTKNVGCSAVNGCVSPTAALVCRAPGISQTGQHEAVTNATRLFLVLSEPGYGPDGARDKKKSEGMLARLLCERASQERSNGHAREIVVRERWMAAVNTYQN